MNCKHCGQPLVKGDKVWKDGRIKHVSSGKLCGPDILKLVEIANHKEACDRNPAYQKLKEDGWYVGARFYDTVVSETWNKNFWIALRFAWIWCWKRGVNDVRMVRMTRGEYVFGDLKNREIGAN